MNATALLKTLSAVALTSALALPVAHAAPASIDPALASRVQTTLQQDPELVKPEINVEVQPGGRVHLTGWVQKPSDVNDAMLAARQVDGVNSVTAFLRSWSSDE